MDDAVHCLEEAQSHVLQEDEHVTVRGHPLPDLNDDPSELQQSNEGNVLF